MHGDGCYGNTLLSNTIGNIIWIVFWRLEMLCVVVMLFYANIQQTILFLCVFTSVVCSTCKVIVWCVWEEAVHTPYTLSPEKRKPHSHTSRLPYIQLATGSIMSCSETEMHETLCTQRFSFENMHAKVMARSFVSNLIYYKWFQNFSCLTLVCSTTSHWGEAPSTPHTQHSTSQSPTNENMWMWTLSASFYTFLFLSHIWPLAAHHFL